LNLGEGAGLLVLESRQSAEKRGAKVLASVMGYGNASDAFHPTAPHPEGLGLKRATLAALNQAGLAPADIGCLNVHGTSTSANDAAEGKVIDEIFGSKLPFVSTKSYTGHAMGAAGGLEAVFTVMALLDQKLPASLGFETMDPQCRVAPVTSNTNLSARYGLSNSLAFGGVNSVLAFGVEA
jgi:3-oxoacyl-(acyl-carrier-protein) synthase